MISRPQEIFGNAENSGPEFTAVGADNTTGRRFRQLEPNILWLRVDFFLTSFPQPTILPIQTRGKIESVMTRFLASINRATGPAIPKT
jgi:hypothetical protein